MAHLALIRSEPSILYLDLLHFLLELCALPSTKQLSWPVIADQCQRPTLYVDDGHGQVESYHCFTQDSLRTSPKIFRNSYIQSINKYLSRKYHKVQNRLRSKANISAAITNYNDYLEDDKVFDGRFVDVNMNSRRCDVCEENIVNNKTSYSEDPYRGMLPCGCRLVQPGEDDLSLIVHADTLSPNQNLDMYSTTQRKYVIHNSHTSSELSVYNPPYESRPCRYCDEICRQRRCYSEEMLYCKQCENHELCQSCAIPLETDSPHVVESQACLYPCHDPFMTFSELKKYGLMPCKPSVRSQPKPHTRLNKMSNKKSFTKRKKKYGKSPQTSNRLNLVNAS